MKFHCRLNLNASRCLQDCKKSQNKEQEGVLLFIGTTNTKTMFSLSSQESPVDRINLCKHLSCPSAFNHVCWVYETNEEHKTVLVDFVKEGIRNKEKVVITYGNPLMKSQILEYFADGTVDINQYMNSEQLLVLPAEAVYTPCETGFVPENVMATYERIVLQALKDGYKKVRAYGDMSFAVGVDFKEIHRYESQLVHLFSRYQNEIVGLCGFPAFVFDGSFIVSMMTTHPKLCIGTESFESNFYYVPETIHRPARTVAEYWISNLRERKAMLHCLKQKNAELSRMNRKLQMEKEEREKAEMEKQQAEDGNRCKRAFIGMLSHEIRTPLFGILSTATLLKDTNLTKDQEEYVSMIGAIGDHLMNVLNDVLDFSKFESGNIELEDRPFAVRDCINSIIEMFNHKKETNKIQLQAFMSDKLPAYVSGDVTRLRQILINLVGNAIKFTPKMGKVSIHVELEDNFKSDRIRLRFSVQDTGIGIAKDKFGKLFCDYQQADLSISKMFGGTGLGKSCRTVHSLTLEGLAICKRLVEAMNGNIWFESEVGNGSIFYFTATFNSVGFSPAQSRKRPQECPRCRPLKVLVAEDNPINQVVIQRMLAKLGHSSQIAENGLEAVQYVQEQDYDLILMDLHMPVMDGIEAMKCIRELDWSTRRKPRIVAVTAATLEEEKQRCMESGMDGFVNKPFQLEQLQAVCLEICSNCKLPRTC